MSRRHAKIAVGITAAAALLAFAGFAVYQQLREDPAVQLPEEEVPALHLQVDHAPIEYEGGKLDFMEGVRAWDDAGKDWTDYVTVTISPDSTIARKTLLYSLTGPDNKLLTAERVLHLLSYSGPTLYVRNPLELHAADLSHLVSVLHESKKLRATDGYQKDITERVTFFREHVQGSEYEITFFVTNLFQDHARQTVRCLITGQVNDPKIELRQQAVTLAVGSEFDPRMMLLLAQDEEGNDAAADVLIDSSVRMDTPGSYQVVYRLISRDQTVCETKVLRVTVK